MSFVFYNPKTNTIERKQQTSQPNTFQMPYLLNIQPQDLNYAMRNTSDLRSYPPFVQYPDSFDKATSNKENYSHNVETKKASRPPVENYEKPSKEFLMMEDLHEDDIARTQQPPKFEKEYTNRNSRNEQRKFSPKKSSILKPTPQPEDERRENFKIMNQEDMMLKYRPEDYSINERILNARFVQEEQERTRKFVLNRMASDIKAIEANANALEKEIQHNEQETKELEAKTQQIWQEIERKQFEMKAKEIMKRIDEAVDYEEDAEQENRYDDFYRENEALYDEIDKVLGEDGVEESAYYEDADMSYRPAKPKISGYRSTSANRNSTLKPGWSVTKPGPYAYKPGSVKLRPQKGAVKAIGMSKPSGTLRSGTANRNGQKTMGQSNNPIFKNPKKVEDTLQRARAIADQY